MKSNEENHPHQHHQINYCKTLNVKNPYLGTKKSVGIDLHVPAFDIEFIRNMCKVNDAHFLAFSDSTGKIFDFAVYKHVIDEPSEFTILVSTETWNTSEAIDNYWKTNGFLSFKTTQDKIKQLDHLTLAENFSIESIDLYKSCTIPTGIAFDIPEGYYLDIRPRSSNIKSLFTCILGTIDFDYTYGCGTQVFIGKESSIKINAGDRICQFLLKKSEIVEKLHELTPQNFEKHQNIIEKRKTRTGGFGHTGK